jgi:hypothetical protein
MKLSEAIRAGAGFPDIRQRLIDPETGGCCLLGGIFKANGLQNYMDLHNFSGMVTISLRADVLLKLYPCAAKLPPCPVCVEKRKSYAAWPVLYEGRAIECLYEAHHWSKRAIAEWVEVQEKRLNLYGDSPAEPMAVNELEAAFAGSRK